MTRQSAGIDIFEKDVSFYVADSSPSIGAYVGITERGPVDEPTLVSTWADYMRTFGGLISGSILPYVVKRALDRGAPALIVRVTERDEDNISTAVKSTANIESDGGQPSVASLIGTVAGPTWECTPGGTLDVKVDGGSTLTATFSAVAASVTGVSGTFSAMNGKTLAVKVNGGSTQTCTFSSSASSASTCAAEINAAISGLKASVVSGQVKIETDKKGTGAILEILSASTGLSELGFTAAVTTGTGDVADIQAVTFEEFKELFEALDADEIAATLNDDNTIKIATVDVGSSASLQVLSSSTLDTVFGFSNTTATGGNTTAEDTLQADAVTPGTWGDDIDIVIEDSTNDPTNEFKLNVKYKGEIVEVYDNLSMNDDADNYIENVVNIGDLKSNYIRVTDLDSTLTAPGDRPNNGTYTLADGDDAISSISDADYLGDSAAKTGMHALDSYTNFSHVSAPGLTSATALTNGCDYAANRADILFAGFLPKSKDVNDMVKFRYGRSPYSHSAFNTTYAAIYFGWEKIQDTDGNDLYIPADGDLFAKFANTDRQYGPWYAAAGIERGSIGGVNGLYYNPSENERGTLYAAGINPIYSDSSYGVVIWGNKTITQTASARDRINVRRMLNKIKRDIASSMQWVVFEPNDPTTWRRVVRVLNPYLQSIKDARGLDDFRVVCDETVNTAQVRNQNKMVCNVYLIPTKTAEFIEFNLVVSSSGVSLEEVES